jgi:serine/threonine protein kinase
MPGPNPNSIRQTNEPLAHFPGDEDGANSINATATVILLAEQVAAMHAAGRIHGRIWMQELIADENSSLLLMTAPLEVTLRSDGEEAELCPPELKNYGPLILPTEIAAARKCLSARKVDMDPRRIDVYQLGGLLCGLVSGGGVAKYLRSVQACRRLPTRLREIVDCAIGFDPNHRFRSCEELATKLKSICREIGTGNNKPAPQTDAHSIKKPTGDGTVQPKYLDKYRIIERIGSGGMGDVYKAYDAALDRQVAIKVLPAELARQGDFVQRFQAEAAAVAKVAHPNIVPIYSVGEDAGQYFFVMQYIRGESLDAFLAQRKRLPIEVTLAIVEQVLHGLAAAHACGLIHRDIKPANILLQHEHNRALIADFGLVKRLADGPSQTITGIILGTVDYLSPEQARGKGVDARSDLYSLGVMMYEMLAGRLPFASDSPTGMVFQHAYERPLPLAQTAPEVPKRIGGLVMRLLAKEPARRPQSAQEVLEEIDASRGKQAPSSEQVANPRGTHGRDATVDESHELPSPWLSQLTALFWDRMPKSFQPPQDTQQQVNGAVEEYERRCRDLAKLIFEVEDVAAQFVEQIASHREAAAQASRRSQTNGDEIKAALARDESAELERAAAELSNQLAQHQQQLASLQTAHAGATATLEQLRSQRESLRARLRMLENVNPASAAKRTHRNRRQVWIVATVAACFAAGISLLLIWHAFSTSKTDQLVVNPTPAFTPAPSIGTSPTRLPGLFAKIVPKRKAGPAPAPLNAPFSLDEAQRAQREWANYFGLEAPAVRNTVGMTLVVTPPGEFTMGIPPQEFGPKTQDSPQHRVRLTKAILASATATTQAEFLRVMAYNPSHFSQAGGGRNFVARTTTEQFPVERVTWFDACAFCNLLSRREGLAEFYEISNPQRAGKQIILANVRISGGLGYRLPTEAEFEYLSRAGTSTPFWHGSEYDGTQGNALSNRPYGTTRPGIAIARTCPVGQYPPNPFGLYDVDGNVSNWCWDWYSPTYYSANRGQTSVDPLGPATGTKRVNRSNSYAYEPVYGRAGRRHSDVPKLIYECVGFRVVRSLP